MAVFRTHKTRNYTVMSNHHLQNQDLSLKAIGLLSKMLSLPDDWEYNVRGLTSLARDGEASVRSGLEELEDAGYLERRRERRDGRFVTVWDIHEVPVSSDEWVDQPACEYEAQMSIPGFDEDEPRPDAPDAGDTHEDEPRIDTGGTNADEPLPEASHEDEQPTEAPAAEQPPEPKKRTGPDVSKVTRDAVAYLNERTGRRYRPSIRKTQRLVAARLREGFTPEDFTKVIDNKVADWGRDPRMRVYLRPETLFGTKFEGYLNQEAKVGHDFSEYD